MIYVSSLTRFSMSSESPTLYSTQLCFVWITELYAILNNTITRMCHFWCRLLLWTVQYSNNRRGSGFISHKNYAKYIPCQFMKHELSLDLEDFKGDNGSQGDILHKHIFWNANHSVTISLLFHTLWKVQMVVVPFSHEIYNWNVIYHFQVTVLKQLTQRVMDDRHTERTIQH